MERKTVLMDFLNSSQNSTNLKTRNKRNVRNTVTLSKAAPPLKAMATDKYPNMSKKTTTASN